VRLVEAVPSAGALRFEMLSPGRRLPASTGKGRRRRPVLAEARNARR